MGDSDSVLVERVLAGNTEPFRELVGRYQDAVYGVALSRTGNAADAEDVAQEAFLSAFGSLEQLRDPARFGSWLYRIAVNCAKVRMRSDIRRRARHEAVPGRRTEHPPADEAAGRNETRARVMDALGRLSQVNREAATLYYIDGYSTADISRFTGRPVGTVKRRLHDARAQLRKELVAMVETELKKGRPGKAFTEKVAATIERVRVWKGGPHGQTTLMLTDSKGRSYRGPMGDYEAEAVLRSISGREPPEAADLHTALVELLRRLGLTITGVGVGRHVGVNVTLTLTVADEAGGERSVELDYCMRDAGQFVVLTGASVTIEEELAESWKTRRADGKTMSPAGAWRKVPKGKRAMFPDVAAVLKALDRNPRDKHARTVIREASGINVETPWIKDAANGTKLLLEWHDAKVGTKHEAQAAGIVGAFFLARGGTPEKGVPYLEKAHELDRTDEAVAFDLATAYMLTGRPEETLAIIEEFRFKDAGKCGNFLDLWGAPRFLAAVGQPDVRTRVVFKVKGTPVSIILADASPSGRFKRARPMYSVPLPGTVSERRRREIGRAVGHRQLVRIARVHQPNMQRDPERPLVLETESGAAVAVPSPSWPDKRAQELTAVISASDTPWRRSSQFTCELLKRLSVKPMAAVLVGADDETAVAALAARAAGRWATVTLDGIQAVTLAVTGGFPLLITQELAEQLYVRGKTGRPVRPRTALRRLRADDGE